MLRTIRIAAAFLLLAAVGGCAGETPVDIGVVLPLTGQWKLYGQPIRKGIELAHDELEAQHKAGKFPYQVRLDVRDSKSDPKQAATELSDTLAKGALAVIGGVTSDEALAMVPVAKESEAVLLSPSASSPELSGISPNFFRIFPSDFREGTRMGNFAAQTLGVKTVIILRADTTYARGIAGVFRSEFERYNGKIEDEISYPVGTEDFTDVVAPVLERKPDGVYLADFAEPVSKVIEKLHQGGYRGRLLTTSAFAAPEVIQALGSTAEGVFLTQTVFDADSTDPAVKSFVEAYQQKYGETPGLYAAQGFDAMMVFGQALREGGRQRSEMWKGMRGLSGYTGVTGTIQFDDKGDVGKFPRIYVVQDGKLLDYDRFVESKRKELLERLKEIERQRKEATSGENPP